MKKNLTLAAGIFLVSNFASANEVCGKIVKFSYERTSSGISVEFSDGKTLSNIQPALVYWPTLSTAIGHETNVCFDFLRNAEGKLEKSLSIVSVSK